MRKRLLIRSVRWKKSLLCEVSDGKTNNEGYPVPPAAIRTGDGGGPIAQAIQHECDHLEGIII